jgi:benzoyl-CoA reductase subunit C
MGLNIEGQYHTEPAKNPALMDWKRQGGRAIGYFCMMVPVEIIQAAGFFPVRILGTREPIDKARAYYAIYSCYLAQSAFESALNGGHDLLDGTVIAFRCDCMRFLSDVWNKILQKSYFYYLDIPHAGHAEGADTFLKREMQDFVRSLEKYTGEKIGDESIVKAIQLYNRLRMCFQKIDALRGDAQISGREAAQLMLYGLLVPPAAAVETLTRVISAGQFEKPGEGPRLMVLCSVHPDLDIFRMAESLGANVIADDLCMAGRLAQPEVKIIDDDPLLSLSRFYLNEQTQCACMTTEGRFHRRLDDVLMKIRQRKVKGVIFTIPRYCDPQQMEYPDLAAALAEEGIPTLLIEIEQAIDTAPNQNRLEAFMEVLSK